MPAKYYNKKKAKNVGKAKHAASDERKMDATLLHTTPLFGVAHVVENQLYYDYQQTLSGGVGAVPTRFYSVNGLYDPDISGTGHQPMGFDSMMALYEHYTVLEATMTVTFYSAGAAARVAVFVSPDGVQPGLPRLVENGLLAEGVVGGTGSHLFKTKEITVNMSKLLGKSKQALLGNPELKGDISSNPTEQSYLGICAWSAFDSSADVTVGFDVTIAYTAQYWEPKKLTSSLRGGVNTLDGGGGEQKRQHLKPEYRMFGDPPVIQRRWVATNNSGLETPWQVTNCKGCEHAAVQFITAVQMARIASSNGLGIVAHSIDNECIKCSRCVPPAL